MAIRVLILFILSIIHIYVLHEYGISTFFGTCLLYFFLYKLCTFISDGIFRETQNKIVRHNIRSTFIILITLEFLLLFVFGILNNYMENQYYLYFSEYKRKEQSVLLQRWGFSNARFTCTELYLPNKTRTINRDDYTITHHYNETGLRGVLPVVAKDSNEYRIVVLGDSFIEGDGAKENETLPVQLQELLSARFPNKKISVINAGISGSNPLYEIDIYERKLTKYQADLIILSVFPNDLSDINIMQHQGNIPLQEYFSALSHLFRIVYFGILNYDNFELTDIPESTSMRRMEIITDLNHRIHTFRNSLSASRQQLLIVYIPSKGELEDDTFDNTYSKVLQNALKSDVNLSDTFAARGINQYDSLPVYYWKNDAHFNPKGYKLAAEIIAQYITDKQYVGTH